MNLEIQFQGFYQCRLATDPDDYRDPRGTSGWTFSLAGEPDLDRVIRFHDPVANRSHAPAIGVWVRQVLLDNQLINAHPLVGARVELAGDAVYEGRNGDIAISAHEPIVPWNLIIQGGGLRIDTFDPIDLGDFAEINRRQPTLFTPNSPEVLAATGIGNPTAYRLQRSQAVQAELAAEPDPMRRHALEARLAELALGSVRRTSLAFQLDYDFELRGPNRIEDPNNALGIAAEFARWQTRFWMGGWDADGLCGYVKGSLLIMEPTKPALLA